MTLFRCFLKSEVTYLFSPLKTSFHGLDVCPHNDEQSVRSNRLDLPCWISYFKAVLVQFANALIKSKHPEFSTRYRRIKARRGHKKAIIAILSYEDLTAILAHTHGFKPYTAKDFLRPRPVNKEKFLLLHRHLTF